VYNLAVDRVAKEILSLNAKRILLQFPEGLRNHAFEVAKGIEEKTSTELVVSGDPCYGACDVPLWQADSFGYDLIVHYGHSKMPTLATPGVLYVEAQIDIDVESVVRKALGSLEGHTLIGLVTTIQHIDQLQKAEKILLEAGKRVLIGRPAGKTAYSGQVLGCECSSAISVNENSEVFLFIGGGVFHPLGLSLATGKEVVVADPYTGNLNCIGEKERMRVMKRRSAAISVAQNAARFGIVIGTKFGQRRINTALFLKKKLEEKGKEALLISMDEINFSNLVNFSEIGAFVDTACPRIVLDGIEGLPQALITAEEALVMLGCLAWSDVWQATFSGDHVA
jgi:2-(3-amino-3-carboxypropyl)histidine synthase